MKKNSTIIFLVLAGLGVWWYMKKKNAKTNETTDVVIPGGKGGPGGGPSNVDIVRGDLFRPDTSLVPQSAPTSDVNFTFSINGFKKKLGNVPNTI
jgi:hypothetical protein